jgi:hypothetical protein
LKNIVQIIKEIENVSEVTPPGYEDVVLALKKDSDVDNPWAVAWSMKNKKDKQKRKK